VQPFPRSRDEKLARGEQIDHGGGDRKGEADHALHQEAYAEAGGHDGRPEPRMRLLFIQSAQERPQRECDHAGQQRVRQQDAREKP
jgi:hypothetical protein